MIPAGIATFDFSGFNYTFFTVLIFFNFADSVAAIVFNFTVCAEIATPNFEVATAAVFNLASCAALTLKFDVSAIVFS